MTELIYKEAAARICDMKSDEILLQCGEMSKSELCAAKAVLVVVRERIRALHSSSCLPTRNAAKTPRTDAMEKQLSETDCCFVIEPEYPTLIDFARSLELETAELRRKLDETKV